MHLLPRTTDSDPEAAVCTKRSIDNTRRKKIMLTVHFKNKEEFYEQIADGSLQKIMMEYFNRSADMGLPIEEDTLFYNFEVEFECVLENG